jgi:two-component system OmpR family response regulator
VNARGAVRRARSGVSQVTRANVIFMRVLLVEDHARLAGLLRKGFTAQGLVCDLSATGEDAVWMAGATPYDVVVLDVMLPGIDGFETCRRLRADKVSTPVLMLTARDGVGDRVAGLNGGADDYVVKPFAFAELLARVRALARRPPGQRPIVLEAAGLRVDTVARRAWRGEVEIPLSAKEFLLLEAFASRPGELLTRGDLLDSAWDHAYDNRSNIVDVYVRRLRAKIDDPFATRTIETVRGSGYRLVEPAHPHPPAA